MFDGLFGLSPRRLFAIGLILAGSLLAVLLIILWQMGVFDAAPPPAALESAVESLRQEQQQTAAEQGEEADGEESQLSTDAQSGDQRGQPSAQEFPEQQGQRGQQGQQAEPAQSSNESGGPAAAAQDQPQPQQQEAQATAGQPGGGAPDLQSLAGTWTLSERGNSFVGYRIGEELANIGTTTAVGRTGEIEATLEFDGAAITAVVIIADLRTLRSDQSFRDSALRDRGIESDTYPFATFTLSEPIVIDALPSAESPLSVSAAGALDLHGVTNAVSIALQGQYVDGLVVVAGSTEIALADYEIEKPTGFRVLSIEDIGIMEFELVFERSE